MALRHEGAAGGRPPTGLKGERISTDYHRLTLRIPKDLHAVLAAASGALRRPQWRVLIEALLAYVGEGEPLSEPERRAVRTVLRLHRSPK